MRAEIARLDLWTRRRSLIAYALGLALYTFVVVAIYPAFKDSTSLNRFTKDNSAAAALFGASGLITSPAGWMNANLYANFFPLIMLLVTIGYGGAALAGQDEDGTLCLVTVLPVARGSILVQKACVMALQAIILACAVAILTIVGGSFDVNVAADNVVGVSAAVAAMSVDFGLVTMATGAITGRKSTAIAIGATVAAVSYVVSSLAPVAAWIRPARYMSLFYWSVGNNQITRGVDLAGWAVLVVAGIIAAWVAIIAFRRFDVH